MIHKIKKELDVGVGYVVVATMTAEVRVVSDQELLLGRPNTTFFSILDGYYYNYWASRPWKHLKA